MSEVPRESYWADELTVAERAALAALSFYERVKRIPDYDHETVLEVAGKLYDQLHAIYGEK